MNIHGFAVCGCACAGVPGAANVRECAAGSPNLMCAGSGYAVP